MCSGERITHAARGNILVGLCFPNQSPGHQTPSSSPPFLFPGSQVLVSCVLNP
ncbi:hypothetical protein GJAV_G00270400 [Gymnothorax javanicus]|nr:hypothetical protein GJAV_G00270400 [Gymnothorax javanicus]